MDGFTHRPLLKKEKHLCLFDYWLNFSSFLHSLGKDWLNSWRAMCHGMPGHTSRNKAPRGLFVLKVAHKVSLPLKPHLLLFPSSQPPPTTPILYLSLLNMFISLSFCKPLIYFVFNVPYWLFLAFLCHSFKSGPNLYF